MTVGHERPAIHEPVPPRRFWFRPDGLMGKIVAEGTLWSDGAVALYTPGSQHITATYDALVDMLADLRIADPAESVQWIDAPPPMAGVEWHLSELADHGAASCIGAGE